MAEGEAGGRFRIYRSVSFKRLENWSAKRALAEGGVPEALVQPPCEKTHRAPLRSPSVSRKLSKISTASGGSTPSPETKRPSRSHSPSVRQLSERFSGAHRAAQGRVPAASPCVSPEPSSACSPVDRARSPESPVDELAAETQRKADPKEASAEAAGHWPSVTEMRKLFGESFRRHPRATEDGRPPWQPTRDPYPEHKYQWAECATSNHSSEDSLPGAVSARHKGLESEGRGSSNSNTPEGSLCSSNDPEQRGAGKPKPPPPPPRSCIPFTLKAHSLPCPVPKQGSSMSSHGLHSWHSSTKSQVSPSPTASLGHSSSEEELHKKGTQHHRNGTRVKSLDRSSGSENEGHHRVLRENIRKRSVRRKKRDAGVTKGDESDDSDGQAMADFIGRHQREHDIRSPDQLRHTDAMKSSSVGKTCVTEHSGGSLNAAFPYETNQGLSLVGNRQGTGQHEIHKHGFRGPLECGVPLTAGPIPLGSTLPVPIVSRVAKVNIPPFMPSPCGSKNSSRYSSTETLKDDETYLGPSRSFQGSFGMYRSTSFGQSDSASRPHMRNRSKLPVETVKVKNESLGRSLHYSTAVEHEKSKSTKSMSNPDIASETLTLLNFLKSDLSDLKVKKQGRGAIDQDGYALGGKGYESCHGTTGHSQVGRNPLQGTHQLAGSSRPTLKDLTATLRRAKSFTYSDKPGSHRLYVQSTLKQSSSELMLASSEDNDALTSGVGMDRRTERDLLADVIQDQYVQEARQVFENISLIGTEHDYQFNTEHKDSRSLKTKDEFMERRNKSDAAVFDDEDHDLFLKKADSEENLSCGKSMEELSGHESSMTDEGIVTEPESGPGNSEYKDSGQPLTVWTVVGVATTEEEPYISLKKELSPLIPVARTHLESAAGGEESVCKNVAPGQMEAPSTPGTIRRRRKFPSIGTNGSDSSNGESSGETYRSLSDPMPHRRCSITDEAKNFSVDSNLLGSLNSKPGIPETSATALSECTGSAASDLSVCSDGLKDYNAVMQNIVRQPGTMDKVIDEKGNGKTIKKKSFSDPSRRGELSSAGFDGPSEPINEMDQPIPPSSSEPILSEQRDELGELEELGKISVRPRSQSEHVLPTTYSSENEAGVNQNFSFDPKLAEILSPRMARRSSKKRTNRVTQQESERDETLALSQTTLGRARPASKHVRHTSEPATFMPIASPGSGVFGNPGVLVGIPEPSRPSIKSYPVLQTPTLEDVTKQYMLALNTADSEALNSLDMARSTPSTPTTEAPKLLKSPKQLEEATTTCSKIKPHVDMRKHVIMTLLDTEQSYVESLRTLMQGYMKPLKQPENSCLCDPALVDEIFDQIPELLEHHEQFLEQVHSCVESWHEMQKVGEVLVQSFSKDILVKIYSAYIDNFLNAKDAVRIAREARPAFLKFLEQCMRENKEKQALSDLMIKPVQRIPRYELIVKDLLKHTPEDHPDHPCLMDAQRNIKQLAERINKGMRSAEEAERDTRIVQEVESHIEGMEDLQAPLRKFLRQEMVVEVKAVGGKKDRSLFLFTDLLVCTTLKRKSGSLRRSSMSLYTAASMIDIASKYKLLWKLPLEDVDIVKGASQATNKESIQKTITRLDEDLSTMGQISKLSETLSFPHQSLDDVIKDMMAAVHRELSEKQSLSFSLSFPPNKMELTTTKADGTESFIFEFTNPDARNHFEQAFEDTKKKLASNRNRLDPEFLKAIPIMKTRSGMQFSCASPSHSSLENAHEVWVCNSDGYVGQVCLLSIKNEPTVEACIAVCSARILCIASVPGLKKTSRDRTESLVRPASDPVPSTPEDSVSQQCLHISISGSSLELSEPVDSASRELMPFDSDDTDDESSPSPSGTLQSQASRSTISSSFGNEEIQSSKDITTETTSSEEEQDPSFLPIPSTFRQNGNSESPMDGQAIRRSSRGSFTRGSLEDLLSIDPEAYQSSMWLGTEDGCIHVYQSSDNIRNRKNSMKMQHAASIMCILYLDNQVFVSLANGELIVYQREAGSFWDPQNSKSLSLGSPGSPVTKMVPVLGKLWCGCQNRVIVLNTSTLLQEHAFHIGQDSNRSVTCIVGSCLGIWVSLQSSAQVRLYHATTYEQLAEVDVAPPVHKMLAGSDAIIRQHKAACLRITALLACKDLLWIGTSAGVVLTLSITSNATSLKAPLLPVGLSQGHTGHVRFLTSVELPDGFDILFPLPKESGNEKLTDVEKKEAARLRTTPAAPQAKSKILVISGGDGYEDFRLTNSSETVGRDDSTNHLLLWRV
ncbi:rho guanine nucleotide exchange factor 17 [Ambystoma mexicanum]|uniref:rho guanine nucleotide exchange factor 17 n=1 Tax=Ambystoma mexicanum TaxID=8296 RepID=UPI0037E8F953